MNLRLGVFISLKSAQLFCYFLTLRGQPLPIMTEKSHFSGLVVSAKVIQYPYITQKTKGKSMLSPIGRTKMKFSSLWFSQN